MPDFHSHTIRTQLLIAFVLLVLLPTIVISTSSAIRNRHSGRKQVVNQLESVVTLKEAEIERWVNSLQANLDIASNGIEAANLEMILLPQTTTSAMPQDVVEHMHVQMDWQRLVKYTSSLFEEVFLMDIQGRVVLTNGTTKVGTVHSNHLYFREGLQADYVHSPLYSPALKRMSVIVAHPVVDPQGQVIGVLAGRASMAVLNEIMLERTGLGETGETYLVGSNHALLTNSLFVNVNVQTAGAARYIWTEGVNMALETRLGNSGLYVNYQDVPVVGVYRWLPNLQVALLAEQNQSEAFRSMNMTLAINASVAVAAVVIAIAMALSITRRITSPLTTLAETATQIAAGNLTLTVEVERSDEIGLLARSFNHMTTRLAELIGNLEQYVAELEQTQVALQESEAQYRTLFEDSPIPLREEDFSEVKRYIDQLPISEQPDFRTYFEAHPQVITHCANLVRISNINQSTLRLFQADSKEEIYEGLSAIFSGGSFNVFREELIALAEGKTRFESEGVQQTLAGDKIDTALSLAIAPGYEETWSKVFISIIDITERKQAEEQVKASLQEKEVLLKEIHHRVKNNMQVISSLLDLQANNIKEATVRDLFKESQQRIKSMALVHERLYQSQSLAQIDFMEYTKSLAQYLLRSYAPKANHIRLRYDLMSVRLSVEKAIPCGLIINELVSNAFKHAFPNGQVGEIFIGLQQSQSQELVLSIRDNGIGLPSPTDFPQVQSLGLTLVKTLVEQIKGTIEWQNNNGLEFKITFSNPVSKPLIHSASG